MRTPVCDLLGIEHPIVQAPIGSAAGPELAAAVSNAGGLGSIALSWTPPGAIAGILERTRALTDRPFAVNLILDWPEQERLAAALDAGARIVSLSWGEPEASIRAAREADAIVLVSAPTAAAARAAVAAGAHAVVAQGWEAGGHVEGEVASMALVPAVVDAVAPVPVLAAGGIADGRGLAAALALGAQGAWIGTRFLLAQETRIHEDYRRLLLGASEADTVWAADLYDIGWEDAPHRALRNSTSDRWEAAGRPAPGARPGEGEVIGARPDGREVVRYSSALPLEGSAGDVEAASLWAGQGVGLVRRVQPAGEIVREIAGEARDVLAGLAP